MYLMLVATVTVVSLSAIATAALFMLGWFAATQLIQRRTPDSPADPAELALDYEEVSFRSRDGLRLGGWFIPGSKPQRGTIVFCHGHAGSLDSDLRYVPIFQKRGFNVLQFDFRGHGRSEGRQVSMGYYERLDLLAAVDYAQALGIDQVGVLGFSMGGAVAISTAAQNPAIAAIVSDGGFARLRPTLQAGLQQRGIPLWLARIVTPWTMRIAGWRLGCDLAEADPQRWVHLISPRPILFVHGGRDRYVDPAEIEALHAAAGNPKALWIVQEAEHRRIDQARPEEYRARVLAFFEEWLAEEARDEPVVAH